MEDLKQTATKKNKEHWLKSFLWLGAGAFCIWKAVYKAFEAGIDACIMTINR